MTDGHQEQTLAQRDDILGRSQVSDVFLKNSVGEIGPEAPISVDGRRRNPEDPA